VGTKKVILLAGYITMLIANNRIIYGSTLRYEASLIDTTISHCCSKVDEDFLSTWTALNALGSKIDNLETSSACNPTIINSVPTTITSPGCYCLACDVQVLSPTVIGITITSSDVTLDLNHHTISGTGPGDGKIGIYCNGWNKITIKNGSLHNIDQGIFLSGNDSTITNCEFINNSDGARLSTGSNSQITNCTARGNISESFVLDQCINTCVLNCTSLCMQGSACVAFTAAGGSTNLFEHCVAVGTLGDLAIGIALVYDEQKTKVIDCLVDTTRTSTAPGALSYGVFLDASATSCLVKGTIVCATNSHENTSIGYNALTATCLFVDNIAYANDTNYSGVTNIHSGLSQPPALLYNISLPS
jgi:parallel beta-helix repeat protein